MKLVHRLTPWLIPVAVFILALSVRLPKLGSFATADEPFWLESSRWFAAGLLIPDVECPPVKGGRPMPASGLGCTLQSAHPGVTTMWGGSLGVLAYYWQAVRPTGIDLSAFLQAPLSRNLDPVLVGWARLPGAVLAALFLAIFYILLRRLFSEAIALLAALLLVFHPVHLAYSRVLHHDALVTTFMLLSVLTMLGYWLKGRPRSWLIFSGVMAGLAFLSKAVAWLLLPYVAVVGIMSLFYREPRRGWPVRPWWSLLGEGVGWAVSAGFAFILFFPAMWVTPGRVLAVMYEQNFAMVDRGHEHYFLGAVSDDPGPLFYPLAWLWHTSPLEIIGLLVLLVMALRLFLWQKISRRPVELALLIFVVMLLLFETASGKKMARYFLPAFPVVAIFAAYGLLWLGRGLAGLVRQQQSRWLLPLLAGFIILAQGGLALTHFPYYLTYANPLFGGPPVAARLMTVGWGEGLEQAAAYLNTLPKAESLTVSSWYNDIFQAYFVGRETSFADDGRAQLAADYVVFYISQIQRQKPYPGLVDYFRSGRPVFVLRNEMWGISSSTTIVPNDNQVHWVEVYQAPAAQSANGDPEIEGVAQLLAYKITGPRVGDQDSAPLSRDDLAVTLFLRVLGPLPEDTTFGVALTDGDLWGHWTLTEVKGVWVQDNIIEWRGILSLPPEMPPGDHQLWAAFQFKEGPVIAEFAVSEKDPPLQIH
ncbi:MAG: glycosyltransferase family 39 protein [Anaerolineae bacterium]|nr:glycosyltransferase family 39 protein [Anaerolineae bacterium]